MQRARVAFVDAVLGSCVGVAGFAYIGFVFATRPLHSGLTADFVAAIVLWLAGLAAATTSGAKPSSRGSLGTETRVFAWTESPTGLS